MFEMILNNPLHLLIVFEYNNWFCFLLSDYVFCVKEECIESFYTVYTSVITFRYVIIFSSN